MSFFLFSTPNEAQQLLHKNVITAYNNNKAISFYSLQNCKLHDKFNNF